MEFKIAGKEKYRRLVEIHTRVNKKLLNGIDKVSKYTFHVDHKYSVKDGFDNGILPCVLGCLDNLEIINMLGLTNLPNYLT